MIKHRIYIAGTCKVMQSLDVGLALHAALLDGEIAPLGKSVPQVWHKNLRAWFNLQCRRAA